VRLRRPEVVFSVTVEYGHGTSQDRHLRLGGSSNDDFPIDRIESDLRRIVDADLPREMEDIYGLTVKTRVITVRDGSIVLFFGVMLSALGVFSSYSDFFESIALVRKHCKMLVDRLLRDRYSSDWQVMVEVQYPSVPDPNDIVPWRRLRRMFGPEADEMLHLSAWIQGPATGRGTRRDAFFWFLLALSILLLGAVGVLVASAVRRMYFP